MRLVADFKNSATGLPNIGSLVSMNTEIKVNGVVIILKVLYNYPHLKN